MIGGYITNPVSPEPLLVMRCIQSHRPTARRRLTPVPRVRCPPGDPGDAGHMLDSDEGKVIGADVMGQVADTAAKVIAGGAISTNEHGTAGLRVPGTDDSPLLQRAISS
jgi:hypothetical protein